MKNIILSIIAILTTNGIFCQSGADKFTFFSPSYSFSNVNIKGGDNINYRSQSHALALNLMRYSFTTNLFEFDGGFGVHYMSSKFNDGRSSANVNYMGFAPELRTKFFPRGTENGMFLGFGGQFFVLPLSQTGDIHTRSFRPMIMAGLSKKYGFTMFLVPTLLKGSVDDVIIEPSWYLGMEIDIQFIK